MQPPTQVPLHPTQRLPQDPTGCSPPARGRWLFRVGAGDLNRHPHPCQSVLQLRSSAGTSWSPHWEPSAIRAKSHDMEGLR